MTSRFPAASAATFTGLRANGHASPEPRGPGTVTSGRRSPTFTMAASWCVAHRYASPEETEGGPRGGPFRIVQLRPSDGAPCPTCYERATWGRRTGRKTSIWWARHLLTVPGAGGLSMSYKLTEGTQTRLLDLLTLIRETRPCLAVASPSVREEWDRIRGRFPSDDDVRQG